MSQEIELTLYLSTDMVIDASSTALYTFSTYGAESGAFGYQDLYHGLQVTTALPEGDYYLSVMADSANTIAESNEDNNVSAFIPVTLLNPKPDLTGESYTYPYTDLYGSVVEAGQVLSFDVYLNNNTEIAAPIGAVVGIYLSEDQTITTDDLLIGTVDMPGLGSYGPESATGEDYTLTQADVGATMSVLASYTDGFSAEETMTSVRTTPIRNVNDAPVGTVCGTGDTITGETLTAGADLSDEDGLGTLSYQWLRGNDAIAGATDATYVLADDDLGGRISVRASYTDGQGMAETVSSAQTGAVMSLST